MSCRGFEAGLKCRLKIGTNLESGFINTNRKTRKTAACIKHQGKYQPIDRESSREQ